MSEGICLRWLVGRAASGTGDWLGCPCASQARQGFRVYTPVSEFAAIAIYPAP